MKIKILIGLIALLLLTFGIYIVVLNQPKGANLITDNQLIPVQINPSDTFIEYIDPSGFSFNYPDNLSIEKSENLDNITYADLKLYSNQVSGSLSFKISDSPYKKIDEWVNLNKPDDSTREVILGNLKAIEIRTKDRLLLGAIDSGVFFNIEVPLIEEEFWAKVYKKVLTDFSFNAPIAASGASTSDILFESEEVVE